MLRELAFELPLLWAGQVSTAPGAVSGWHHHDSNDSSLYVVSGILRLEFEGEAELARRTRRRLRARACLHRAPGEQPRPRAVARRDRAGGRRNPDRQCGHAASAAPVTLLLDARPLSECARDHLRRGEPQGRAVHRQQLRRRGVPRGDDGRCPDHRVRADRCGDRRLREEPDRERRRRGAAGRGGARPSAPGAGGASAHRRRWRDRGARRGRRILGADPGPGAKPSRGAEARARRRRVVDRGDPAPPALRVRRVVRPGGPRRGIAVPPARPAGVVQRFRVRAGPGSAADLEDVLAARQARQDQVRAHLATLDDDGLTRPHP